MSPPRNDQRPTTPSKPRLTPEGLVKQATSNARGFTRRIAFALALSGVLSFIPLPASAQDAETAAALDLFRLRLVQTGSRIRYRLQIAGEAQAIDDFRAWVEPRMQPGQRIEGIRDARPEIRSALERAEKRLLEK